MVIFYPKISKKNFAILLSFSGSYLFAITIIHILPELYHDAENMTILGSFVLIGYFMQMLLGYFSSGIEHGHMHHHAPDDDFSVHNEFRGQQIAISMMVSLSIHAFLEGTLLANPIHHHIEHHQHQSHTLMYGLLMHKIPEAVALAAVLAFGLSKRWEALLWLLLFSLASPLGLGLSDVVFSNHWFGESFFEYLFAIVAGNFLYISTTIFFESNPNHQWKHYRLLVAIGGTILAVLAELILS
jgi:zinc transporter ZupT